MTNLSGKKLGQWGEELASRYLVERGYQMLEKNYRTQYGEIDLIFRQEEVTVFVEVKTRKTQSFGFPEEAITQQKKRHLMEASQTFLQENPELDGDWRIDVIAILSHSIADEPQIEHFENAIY